MESAGTIQRMTAAPRDVEQALLTPVLELTVMVAQAGYRAVPRIEPPALLRPFLGFTRKVPKTALRAARRVLDDDEGFRARLSPVVTDEVVGEAGVLYVQRPEGWAERLEEIAAAEHEQVESASAQRSERAAERRLASTGAALERAEQALAKLRAELDVARAQLAEERRLRVDARDAAAQAGAEATRWRTEAEALRVRADRVEASSADVGLADAALRARVATLESELLSRGTLAEAVGAALASVQGVHAAMLLLRSDVAAASVPADVSVASDRSVSVSPRLRRRPIPLPGGVLDDSGAAAQHLLRTADVRVLVDGYNISKLRWPTLPPTELRERLLAAIAPIAARTGARLHVVFDGDGDARTTALRRGTRVRVSFTAKGREADDEILALLADEALAVPVVVVSNDRRVIDGARAAGASTLSADAFIAGWSSTATV